MTDNAPTAGVAHAARACEAGGLIRCTAFRAPIRNRYRNKSMHEYVGPPLTRSSLARLLAAEGITESSYHLYGAHISDALVLDQRCEGWVVFYSERGGESGVRRYDTEADACLYMLERLLRYEHYRYELVAGPTPAAEADAAFEAWLRDQGLTRIDFRDDEYKVDEVPWKRDEPDYRRYFVHRKRFRKRFGRWP